jgi:guanine nucleotide exchange factor VAV
MNEYSINDTLGGSGPHSSTSNLHLDIGGGQLSLYLRRTDQSNKFYTLLFKNRQERQSWKESLEYAKRRVKPPGQRAQNHFFDLTNFDKEILECSVCNKYLLGSFFQGYKCFLCSSVAHMDCLTKVTHACSSKSSSAPSLPSKVPPPVLPPTPKPPVTQVSTRPPQIARALFNYNGKPMPSAGPALRFNSGDAIQITDDDDDEWYKGFVVTQGSSINRLEGYFPVSFVEMVRVAITPGPDASQPDRRQTALQKLTDCAWFAPVDRNMADLILTRIPNDPRKTLFMVRYRVETGGYAISIKHSETHIDHIKINETSRVDSGASSRTSVQASQTIYSIDQQRNFDSIQSLVNYYSTHSLRDNFPQLDTTLGTPYRLELPMAVGVGTAEYDFNPQDNPNNTGEQIELKKGRKYFVLGKEKNGWWRVYNSEGLIGYVPGSYLNEIF